MKNLLLLTGGGSTEHEISLISAKYIISQIDQTQFTIHNVEIDKNLKWKLNGKSCELNFGKKLVLDDSEIIIDVAIPCLHGYPGETGDIQSLLELMKIPYLGCNSETSVLCFNKLMTKLFLELSGVKTTPFYSVTSKDDLQGAISFFHDHKVVYVKATNQGSSVGCYRVTNEKELKTAINEAFTFSPFVILEKDIQGRELEVSVFEYQGKWITTKPGEIVCPNEFYTYEEKYSNHSHTQTHIEAPHVSPEQLESIYTQASIAIKTLKLRHLSRIDFFLTKDGEIFINEINTFPGHTEISMFPTMMEHAGVKYYDYLNSHLSTLS